MATRHKPLPITEENIAQALSQRAAVRCEDGVEQAHDNFGDYLANNPEGFVAAFKQAQQALASHEAEQVRELGDKARQAHAEAVVANYPK